MDTAEDASVRRGLRWYDPLLAILTTVVVWVVAEVAVEPPGERHTLAGWVLGLLVGVVQLGRPWSPIAVLYVDAGLLVAYHLLGFPAIGLVWPLLVAYLTAAVAGRLRAAAVLALGLSSATVGWRIWVEGDLEVFVVVGEVQSLAVVGLALAVGEAVWQRRRWSEEVRARMERAAAEARREREHALAQQRLAVAADLHDVVAHTLVVIGLQLRIASETVADDPEACREALDTALAAHDEALNEARSTVQVLRSGEGNSAAPRHPTPDLDDVRRLGERAAAAGVDLDVRIGEEVSGTAAATVLIAYRIGQEALTNTVKHSGAQTATLRLAVEDDDLHLLYTDDGTVSHDLDLAASGGHGLAGIHERARSIGGRAEAVPAPSGSMRVEAWLPVESTGGAL